MGAYLKAKPTLDFFLAAAGLVLLSPLFLLIALLVKASSPGPVLFRQARVGFRERPFTILKFRTMYAGADGDKELFRHLDVADGPVFKIPDDPRLTGIGRFLNRTFLDELPQLWNILRGEMSFVGPRPPVPEEVVYYEGWMRGRFGARPGLASPWVVRGRHRLSFDEWMRSDVEYIGDMSLAGDLDLLFRTAVLASRALLPGSR